MTTSFELPRVRAWVGRVAPRSGAETPPEQAVAVAEPAADDHCAPSAPTVAVGARLRAARTARGLSLIDCEAELHIRAKFLVALEDERDDELPEPAYARIFTRSYATMLGLDAVAVVRELDRRTGDVAWQEHETVLPAPAAAGRLGQLVETLAGWRSSRRARTGRVALVVVVAIAVLVFFGYRAESRPAAPVPAPTTLGPANLAPPTPVPSGPATAVPGRTPAQTVSARGAR